MARSDDTRHPLPFQRGVRRYHDIGGHVPPGDDGRENSRDHERIWFELRHRRGCCGCDQPGLKYCFDFADYPTLVCEGLFPPDTAALIDFYPGDQAAPDGISLAQGCGGGDATQWNAGGDAIFYPDGSWRNGPSFIGNGGEGQFLSTGASWSDNEWMEGTWSFEFFIKPSSTDMAFQERITSCGNFGLGDPYAFGGFVTAFGAAGTIRVGQEQHGFTSSAPGVIVADEWTHIVYTYDGAGTGAFSIYVNGRRVVFKLFAPGSFAYDDDVLFAIKFGNGSITSDVSRYWGLMPASEIRRRSRTMLGVTGPDGVDDDPSNPDDGGAIIEDPTFLIDDLDPSQIAGSGSFQDVLLSLGDSAYWETPDGSPFELEERKDQALGYAGLDATTKVPTAELGTGAAAITNFLRGDRTWEEGELIPGPPTELNQMIRAEPAPSAEYVAYLPVAWETGEVYHYPLTQAASPWSGSPTLPDHGNLVTGAGAPTVVDDPNDYIFDGETVLHFDSGDGLASTGSPFSDGGRWAAALWLKIDEIPASTVNLFKFNGLAGIQLLSDGNLQVWKSASPLCTTTVPMPTGEWLHVVFGNDGAGGGTGSVIWVNGVQVASGGGAFGSAFGGQIQLANDGFVGSMGHLTVFAQEWVGRLSTADVLALYLTRRPVWTIVDTGLTGIDVAEEDATVTATLRPEVNFKAGANVALTVTDDPTNNRVDVEIGATAPAGSGVEVLENGAGGTASPRGVTNYIDGFGTTASVTDDAVNDEVEVTFDLPDASGAAEGDALVLDAGLLPIWSTPAGGGGGSSGVWEESLDLPLTTLTGWTQESGSWSTDGTKFISTAAGAPSRVRYDTPVPMAGAIFECDIQIPTAGTNLYAGFMVGWDGTSNGGTLIRFQRVGGVYQIQVENQSIAAYSVVAFTWAPDTWYRLKAVVFGNGCDVYVDDVYVFSCTMAPEVNAHRFGFLAHQTAAWFRNLTAYKIADGGFSSDPYLVEPAFKPPVSAHAKDDEFTAASLDAKWSWINQGTRTATLVDDFLDLYAPGAAGAMGGIIQAAPSGDFTAWARLDTGQPIGAGPPSYKGLTVGVTSGNQIFFGYGAGVYRIWRMNSSGNWVSAIVDGTLDLQYRYIAVRKVGTSLRFLVSDTGRVWTELSTTYRQTIGGGQHITSLDKVGLQLGGTVDDHLAVEFFRVTEP